MCLHICLYSHEYPTDVLFALYSDQTDPYNRQPLALKDVVPETALRKRIEEWRAERRRKKVSPVTEDSTISEPKPE